MKKTITFIAALAVSLMGLTARAQDKQIANHLAVGITTGLDGIGLEVAIPMSPYVQLRTGYSLFPFAFKGHINLGNIEAGGATRDLTHTPIKASLWHGGAGKLLADIFPGRNTSFHFTVGAYMGPGKLFHASADLSGALDPADYATMAVTYGQGADKISISTDPKGFVNADIKVGVVRPYVGIGFGRAVNPDNRVRVTFDMGVLITGGFKVQSYSYLRNPKGDPSVLTSAALIDDDGHQIDNGWIDKICGFPIMPMMKLNVFFRLF